MRENKVFCVKESFSKTPGPRYMKEGEYSGELFRESLLYSAVKNAIDNEDTLLIDLDGTSGYGTSFLEEAFGGLIRKNKLSYEAIERTIKIKSEEEDYLVDDIKQYLKDARDEEKK